MTPPQTHRLFIVALIAGFVILAMAMPPVAAQNTAGPAIIAAVHSSGAADVSLRSTYDLTTDAEQEAFRSLMDDEQAQQEMTDRYHARMQAVAADAEDATGREMTVTAGSIDLERSGDTGIMTLTVRWEGFAAVEDDSLIITEPFASGFTLDRPVVIVAPDGYQIASATPPPAATGSGTARWATGTDLSGFAVELAPTESTTTTTAAPADATPIESNGQPGFGVLVALLAVLLTSGLTAFRRRNR